MSDAHLASDPKVLRYDCTSGGAQFCQGCYQMEPDSDGDWVRYEDYAAQERWIAELVNMLRGMIFVAAFYGGTRTDDECDKARALIVKVTES